MTFQGRLGLLPQDAKILTETLAVSRGDGYLVFFNAGGPVLRASEEDLEELRLAGVKLLDPTLGGGVAVGVLALVSQDGETHWMEGVMLLGVYLIMALTFFHLPEAASSLPAHPTQLL